MKMKLLAVSSTVLVIGAFAAAACTITEGDVDSIGGFGGSDDETGGSSSTGGTNTGGSATGGEGGGGGEPAVIDCQEDGESDGTAASCDADEGDDDCTACMKTKCCAEFSVCTSVDPDGACRYGWTALGDGSGEFDCILSCLQDLGSDFFGTQEEIDTCAAACGSAECNPDSAGPLAVDLAACMTGVSTEDSGCQTECSLPFE